MRVPVHLDIDEGRKRVTLQCGYFDGVADMCKSVSGASWSKVKKQWSYPLSMQTLRALRRVFGDLIESSPELWAWAKEARSAERSSAQLSRAKDARLRAIPEIAPQMAEAMAQRTYQRVGARFVAAAGDGLLIADEPGLGKTITSLGGIIESGLWNGHHLVVCPKTSIFPVWRQQIERWTGATVYDMPDGADQRKNTLRKFMTDPSETKFLVVNKEMMRREWSRYCNRCGDWEKKDPSHWPLEHHLQEHEKKKSIYSRKLKVNLWPEIVEHEWTTLIVDEAHSTISNYRPSNITQMMQGLVDCKTQKRIALTGTPLRGDELKIWGYLEWFGVPTGGFWAFADSYFDIHKGFFGATIGDVREDRRDELNKLLDRYVLRRTRSEVRPDLPLGRREDVLVEMSDKHRSEYEQFAAMGELAIEGGSITGKGLLSELTRLRQMAFGMWRVSGKGSRLLATPNSPKIDWLIESFLAERGITGNPKTSFYPQGQIGFKYVVASQFNEVLDAVGKALSKRKIPYLRLDGRITGKKRSDVVQAFNRADPGQKDERVLLLNSRAGGESIDLDAWCDEMVILDETFIADDQVQLEGRINNRSGRVAPRVWWYVRTEDTIEEALHHENQRQHNLQHRLLDGRRGVNVALHLLRGEEIDLG